AQPRRSGTPRRLFAVPGAVADRLSDHAAGCRRHRDVRIPVVLVGISVRAGLLDAERFENHAAAAQRLFRRECRRMGQCDGRLGTDDLADPTAVSAIADADDLWPRRRFGQAIITYFDSALLDRLRQILPIIDADLNDRIVSPSGQSMRTLIGPSVRSRDRV